VTLGELALAVRWFGRAIDEAGPEHGAAAETAEAVWKGAVARAHQVLDEALRSNLTIRQLTELGKSPVARRSPADR
jgi:hypothetical protein